MNKEWRQYLIELLDDGVKLEVYTPDGFIPFDPNKSKLSLYSLRDFRIPGQSMPSLDKKEQSDMQKVTKEQIQKQKLEWAEDFIDHVKTGHPMRKWQYGFSDAGLWTELSMSLIVCSILDTTECRRKPMTYTFYCCIVKTEAGDITNITDTDESCLQDTIRLNNYTQLSLIESYRINY